MPDAWKGLDAAFAELEAECTEVARGLTVRIWNGILSKTPQYEGRMAASWSYSIGAPEYVDRSALVSPDPTGQGDFTHLGYYKHGVDPIYKGHPVAIGVANSTNQGKDKAFKLGDTIYIANGVDHGEGAYSGAVEDGNVILRAENLPGAPVSRTLDWASVYFNDISPQKAMSLKVLTIGSPDASSNS